MKQPEQNKTAEQAKKFAATILGYDWRKISDDDTIVAGYIQGHADASQQTASLQKQLEERNTVSASTQAASYLLAAERIRQLQKQLEELREENEVLRDLLDRAINCADHIHSMSIRKIRNELKALNHQDNQED